MKICLINFASPVGWYPKGQQRLADTARKTGFTGDLALYQREAQLGCPAHGLVPYAFKPYALDRARVDNYDVAFYCDASVFIVRSMSDVINHLLAEGHFFEEAGHSAGTWCKDAALATLKATREELFNVPLFTAGCMGLNLRHPRSLEFLRQWLAFAQDGITFPGPWSNGRSEASADPRVHGHRHDMTAGSVIAHRLGMSMLPGHTFLAYTGGSYATPKPSTIFHLHPA